MIHRLKWWVGAIAMLFTSSVTAQTKADFSTGFYHSTEGLEFAQKTVKTLTFRQQLAQLLMVPAWSRELRADEMLDSQQFQKRLLYQIRDCGVGGVIFFQGNPLTQVYLTNYFQQESNLPLLIGIDGEWGPAMRLSAMEKYPFQMTLGATYNTHLAYQTGLSMGAQCKRLGIHINFTPSVDVNTEPNNPIIGFRSFGSDPNNVSPMAAALVKGMQTTGVLASAKHFPGHGDTKTDSHKDLPVVEKSLEDLLRDDISPFKHLIDERVASIMVAHLKVPSIDSVSPLPSSISPRYVSQWLRKDLGYAGLIITDALNMKGVAKMASPADVALLALKAGNDIILFPEDVVGFLDSAEKSRGKGEIDSAEIAERVIRLIATKYDLGLFDHRFVDPVDLELDLLAIKSKYNRLYAQQVYDESLILCRFHPQTEPLSVPPQAKESIDFLEFGNHSDSLFVLVVGDSLPNQLHAWMGQYRNGWWGEIQLPWSADSLRIAETLLQIAHHPFIVLGMDWPTWGVKSRQIPKPWAQVIAGKIEGIQPKFYVHFGHQYGIQSLATATCKTPLILAHEWNEFALKSALRMVFGLSHHYSVNNVGLPGVSVVRNRTELDYAHGQLQGYDPSLAEVLDSLLQDGLAKEIFPSAQLVVLKNGLIVANVQAGFVKDQWGNSIGAHQDHIYDVASITKIAATTTAFMKLYGSIKGLHLDHPIAQHWPELSSKQNSEWVSRGVGKVTFRELLTHQSGLPAFLPLTKMALLKGAQSFPCGNAGILEGEGNHSEHIVISQGVCMEKRWSDSAWKWMLDCIPATDKSYVYSDINMIILGKWIEYKTGMSLSDYCSQEFYRPMGLKNTGFQPLSRKVASSRIAPTLHDSTRLPNWIPRGEVRGIVHDPSAMLLGGISGNAGLFSNAIDLARFMYMLQEKGYTQIYDSPLSTNDLTTDKVGYLLNPTKVELFTKVNNPKGKNGYRGLGFDKPNGKEGNKANVFEGAPTSLFGHSGYTGTWAWSDPENGITFVFLSNRTYPTELNKKISQMGFRGQLLQTVYERLESVK